MWTVASYKKTKSCHFSPQISYAPLPLQAGIILVVDLAGDCAATFDHVLRGDWERFRQLCTEFPSDSRIVFQFAGDQQRQFAYEIGDRLADMEGVEYVIAQSHTSSNSSGNDLAYDLIRFSGKVNHSALSSDSLILHI